MFFKLVFKNLLVNKSNFWCGGAFQLACCEQNLIIIKLVQMYRKCLIKIYTNLCMYN